jgi:hypothetical protein
MGRSRARHAIVFRAGKPTQALTVLAEGIEKARLGLTPAMCEVAAEGYVARLHRAVYAALSDVLGSTEDVEKLLAWPGPPELLTLALADAGYIRQIEGVWYCVSAVSEAPEYVRKRWIRNKRGLYQAAVRRANPPSLPDEQEVTTKKPSKPVQSLFAIDQPDEPRSRDVKLTVDYWAAKYLQVYGVKYPFRPSDFGLLKHFCRAVPNGDERARAIEAYLSCRERFFAGHSIHFLVRFLPRWRAAAAGKRQYPADCNLADLIRQPIGQRDTAQDGAGQAAGGNSPALACS